MTQPNVDADPYDLAEYLISPPPERLRILVRAWEHAPLDKRMFFEGQMLGVTIDMDEHPEWFNHGCLCALCRSYGD